MSTTVTMRTNLGDIKLSLDDAKAPETVRNFVKYVEDGHYDGTIFHRVIDNFMIQGGGFDADMRQKSTRSPVKNEADNGLANDCGTIAMARTMDVDSATAQFFINVADNDFLNHQNKSAQGYGYCVFGKVTDGMDVVEDIKGAATGQHGPHSDVPLDAIIIESVSVD